MKSHLNKLNQQNNMQNFESKVNREINGGKDYFLDMRQYNFQESFWREKHMFTRYSEMTIIKMIQR